MKTIVRMIGLAAFIAVGASGCKTPPQSAPAVVKPSRGACRNVPPAYPLEARRLGLEGLVKAAVLIAADGTYKKGEVRKSSGSRILDDATIAAASTWCWKPTYEKGVPVEGWQEFDYRWSLQ